MRPARLLALLSLLCCVGVTAGTEEIKPAQESPPSRQELIAAGKRIYLHGILPGGNGITARVRGDVTLQGAQYACANCHRRSGIGSSEGGDIVPPVVGSSLFSPRVSGLHAQYPSGGGMLNITRPAYTTETLGQVLRQGIDPAGRALSPLMPRFVLTDEEVRALSAYLSTLTVSMPPGIGDKEIHFATITTPGSEADRGPMLEVFTTFFRDKNAGTRSETRRAENAPYHKEWVYGAYRQWRLHVWDLRGPEQTWPAQLQGLYEKQPVFAIIGGVGKGNWQPIHRFCEQQEMPCVLPHIALPPSQADRDFYSIYFSRGVELEAQALASVLSATGSESSAIIQVLRDTPAARAAAGTLRQALPGKKSGALTDIVLKRDKPLSSDFWSQLAAEHGNAAWVLWLDRSDLTGLERLAPDHAEQPAAIYLSATLQNDISQLQQHPLHHRFTLLSPHQIPGDENNTFRFRTWARLRKLPVSDLHLQSSSFLAATLVGESLMHLRGNLSREYFIERIEHMMDNMINTSLYPRLSLAPGQRYAAKGCYVWDMDKRFDSARWIVP